ncbi:MAG: hypothetical protein JW795_12800, partial [Chitinivibrionales bacterium]|nr:hypothetical protein [Chitinivibrionales bacterium]
MRIPRVAQWKTDAAEAFSGGTINEGDGVSRGNYIVQNGRILKYVFEQDHYADVAVEGGNADFNDISYSYHHTGGYTYALKSQDTIYRYDEGLCKFVPVMGTSHLPGSDDIMKIDVCNDYIGGAVAPTPVLYGVVTNYSARYSKIYRVIDGVAALMATAPADHEFIDVSAKSKDVAYVVVRKPDGKTYAGKVTLNNLFITTYEAERVDCTYGGVIYLVNKTKIYTMDSESTPPVEYAIDNLSCEVRDIGAAN